MLRKKILYIFMYISILILLWKLYHADYLTIPIVQNAYYLSLSICILFLGVISNALIWKKMLYQNGSNITFKDAYVSVGLFIFLKYIPGKVAIVLGRAEYVSQKYKIPLQTTASVSFQSQIVMVWACCVLGLVSLLNLGYKMTSEWFLGLSLVTIAISLAILSPLVLRLIEISIKRIFRKEIKLPFLDTGSILKCIIYFFINWILWSLAFYFMVKALAPITHLSPLIGLLWSLATCIGILAFIAPGGLGVRESVIVIGLSAIGMDIQLSTSIAIFSRLWFLIGESFMFSTALLLSKIGQ